MTRAGRVIAFNYMIPRMRTLRLLFVAALVTGRPLDAQATNTPRWQEIGTTVTGNKVFIDARSISRDSAGIITATVRTVYTDSVVTPQGVVRSIRSVAMFDCARRQVAAKETVMLSGRSGGTVVRRSAPARPGFGPVFTSNFSGVALEHLCKPAGTPSPPAPRP
jgi:hypothetical protein